MRFDWTELGMFCGYLFFCAVLAGIFLVPIAIGWLMLGSAGIWAGTVIVLIVALLIGFVRPK